MVMYAKPGGILGQTQSNFAFTSLPIRTTQKARDNPKDEAECSYVKADDRHQTRCAIEPPGVFSGEMQPSDCEHHPKREWYHAT
jgi:hypothetical protein